MKDFVTDYWKSLTPVWDRIDIYEGETVFLETYAQTEPPAGELYAAHFAESEISNGGFHQFFSNSTGILAPEAVEGMQLIGMNQTATIIENAMALLRYPYLRDRTLRQAKLETLAKEALSALDKQFYQLIWD